MPRGGRRIGAGRKPGRRVLAFAPEPKPVQPVSEAEKAVLAFAPGELSEVQAAVWAQYAPLALERSTLTAATVPAFRLLCELEAFRVTAGVKAAAGGASETRLYLQLAKQIEGLMARFRLAPFGKPVEPSATTPVADEDAAFFGGSRAV